MPKHQKIGINYVEFASPEVETNSSFLCESIRLAAHQLRG